MSDHWFVPQTRGFGAQPANWKGWAALAVFVALIVVLALIILMPWEGMPLSTGRLIVWLVLTAALTLGFVWLAEAKTLGVWRWRSGREND